MITRKAIEKNYDPKFKKEKENPQRERTGGVEKEIERIIAGFEKNEITGHVTNSGEAIRESKCFLEKKRENLPLPASFRTRNRIFGFCFLVFNRKNNR